MALSGHTRLGLSEGLDTQVQGTNDDAQISKLSCAQAGYFQDEYVHYFVRRPVRRSPLINRGYYSRYAGLRKLLSQFLDLTTAFGLQSQVLILGAGYDTTWFQLAAAGKTPTRVLELDFKEVTQRKVAIIKQQADLLNLVQQHHRSQADVSCTNAEHASTRQPTCAGMGQLQPSNSPLHAGDAAPATAATASAACGLGAQSRLAATSDDWSVRTDLQQHPTGSSGTAVSAPSVSSQPSQGAARAHGSAATTTPASHQPHLEGIKLDPSRGELISSSYSILPADLRDTAALTGVMQRAGFDRSLPTYLLSECVLVYMEPASSSAILTWASQYFSNAAVVVYEQIKPDDAFGRQMMSNLEARGCPLRGLPATPTLEAHCQRLLAAGWQAARAWDMDSVYKWHLDPQDKQRIERLEVFDEFEEWHLIQEHYSISLATVGHTFALALHGDSTATHVCQSAAASVEPVMQLGFGLQGMVAASQADNN